MGRTIVCWCNCVISLTNNFSFFDNYRTKRVPLIVLHAPFCQLYSSLHKDNFVLKRLWLEIHLHIYYCSLSVFRFCCFWVGVFCTIFLYHFLLYFRLMTLKKNVTFGKDLLLQVIKRGYENFKNQKGRQELIIGLKQSDYGIYEDIWALHYSVFWGSIGQPNFLIAKLVTSIHIYRNRWFFLILLINVSKYKWNK